MPTKGMFGAGLGISAVEVRRAGAATGVSLSTTSAFTPIPKGTNLLELIPRNFSTAVVARWLLLPYLAILKTTDALAAWANATDYSAQAQDGDSTTNVDVSALATLANGGYLLIGSPVPFRGLAITIANANAVVSVLSAKFWNGSAWTAVASPSDGSASGGATLAISGNFTFTVPATWAAARFVDLTLAPTGQGASPFKDKPYYWLRLEVSAALTNPTKASQILAMARNTSGVEIPNVAGISALQPVVFGPDGVSGVEALTDAGTANMIVNCYSEGGFSQS